MLYRVSLSYQNHVALVFLQKINLMAKLPIFTKIHDLSVILNHVSMINKIMKKMLLFYYGTIYLRSLKAHLIFVTEINLKGFKTVLKVLELLIP